MPAHSDKFAKVCNLIFDLDGTLIDSSDGIVQSAIYAFEKLGTPAPSADEIKKLIGYPLEKLYTNFASGSTDDFIKIFRDYGNDIIVNSARPLDGVEMTLGLLDQYDYKLAIATTKGRYHLEAIIERLGWKDYFVSISSGDDVKNVKPDPEQILMILSEMNGKPENTIVIGDTVNDILAAESAGLMSVAVQSPYGNTEVREKCNPELHLNTISDLLQYLI